jgi:MacB-like periplasmic core domain
MRAVRRLVAHQLSVGWRGWAVLALLIGLAGGVVMTAAAGARRTDTAYPRFLVAYKAADALVSPAGDGTGGYDEALGRLPGVAAAAPLVGVQVLPFLPDGKLDGQAVVAAPLDGRFGHTLQVPKMLAGRQPLASRPDEVMVDQIAAHALHLRVGSKLKMGAIRGSAIRPSRRLTERVVGIMVTPGSVVPVTDLDKAPMIFASAGLYRELGPAYRGFDGSYVKLAPGTTLGSLSQQAASLARRFPATRRQVFVADESAQAATVERSIRPQAVALALFALVLALTALLIIGQVAARLLLTASADNRALAALGMSRSQLFAVGLAEVGLVAAAGAAVACAVAIAASPLMPIGPARLAEPHPGVSIDFAVLAVGFVGVVALLLARVAWPAWRQASARHAEERDAAGLPGRRSRTAELLMATGAPVTAVTGVRYALDPGQGRSSVPVRSAVLGLALSAAAVAGAVTFGANLLHLVNTPRLYGQDWDAAVDLQFSTISRHDFDAIAARIPGISGWTFGIHGTVGIGDTVVPAIGLAAGRGPLLSPTLLAGVAARAPADIVLGSSVLRAERMRVGGSAVVTAGGRQQTEQIVGRAVFPFFGEGSFTPTDIGNGAAVPAALLEPQAAASNGSGYNFVLVRFRPGTRPAAVVTRLERAMRRICARAMQSTCVVVSQRPDGVDNFARIDGTPEVLAAILAVLGLAVLGQFAVVSARRRRHDFAILKTLGLLRRQLAAVTAWQVTVVTGLGLLVGLPLGVAAGHWAWEQFAGAVGLSTGTITPVLFVLTMVPAAVLAANATALLPGQLSARRSPAAVLRAE